MEIEKRLKEIASLLWNNGYEGVVCFDHKSYDDEGDIPRIKVGSYMVKVKEFAVSKDGISFSVMDNKWGIYSFAVTGWSDEWADSYYESIGLFDLLRDVYYETTESCEIGDYELDFINH